MKCPKCGYLGFETGDRCKNCGYDFSLAIVPPVQHPELPLHDASPPEGPLVDLPLADAAFEPDAGPDLDRLIGVPEPAAAVVAPPTPVPEARGVERPAAARAGSGEAHGYPEAVPNRVPAVAETHLPLFSDERDPDPPLIAPPIGPPRAPVAVRRSTPRPRATPELTPRKASPWGNVESKPHPRAPRVVAPSLDLDLPPAQAAPVPAAPRSALAAEAVAPARVTALRRLAAAAVDLLLFAGIDAAVLYFTLRIADLRAIEIPLIPAAPFVAFLVLLKIGYLAAFTAAGGQTIGKMAAGLRVAGTGSLRVPVGAAVLRSGILLLTLIPAGLLWLPALFGSQRGLHDRAAGTRVLTATRS